MATHAAVDSSWAQPLRDRFADRILGERESAPGEIEFKVTRETILEFLGALQRLEGGGFDHLADLTGYDDYPRRPRFYALYELISMTRKLRVSVLVPLEEGDETVPSATGLWEGANWLERETFDMLGIKFGGHPDMRRMLLPQAFVGYPLRKNFVVDYRQQYPEGAGAPMGGFDPFGNTIVNVAQEEES